MMKRILPRLFLPVASFAGSLLAVQPNLVETTTLNVDGSGSNVVTTEYSDGLGRGIQSKLKLSSTKDRLTCTFYDEAGRQKITTKPFTDTVNAGEYLAGDTGDAAVKNQLQERYNGETRAFSENEYWDDPAGAVKKGYIPGLAYIDYAGRSWTFGVTLENKMINIAGYGSAYIENGLIPLIGAGNVEAYFDQLRKLLLSSDTIFALPTHFLTVSLTYDNHSGTREAYITESLSDIQGRTIRTLSSPTINSRTGSNVIAGYHHDSKGSVLNEIPPKKGSLTLIKNTEYRYNTTGKVIWKKTPDGGEFEYIYRKDGQIKSVLSYVQEGGVKKLVRRVGYNYDEMGRLIYIYCIIILPDFLSTEIPLDQVRYHYDNLDTVKQRSVFIKLPATILDSVTNIKGRLVARESINHKDGGGLNDDRIIIGEIYSYDEEGRVKFRCMTMTGSELVQETRYTYNIHGNVLFEDFFYGGDHIRKKFTYDSLGRLVTVEHGKPQPDESYNYTILSETSYDDIGRVTLKGLSAISPGTYTTEYAYDILDRITEISSGGINGFKESIAKFSGTTKTDSGFTKGGTIKNIRYIYGNSGDTIDNEYNYDDLNRLAGSIKIPKGSAAATNSYNYDNVGRFESKTEGASVVSGYMYYDSTSRLKKTSKNPATGKGYIYDKQGNLMVDFTKNVFIEYDWRDMPYKYGFYSDLSLVGLVADSAGTVVGDSIQVQIQNKIADSTITRLSTVLMLYDVDGNRVCKMEVKE